MLLLQEMKAQFEVHNLTRGEAGAQLDQALHVLPVADEMLQRQFYGQLEERWRNIASQIAAIQASLQRSLSLQDCPVAEKVCLLEKELKDIHTSMTDMHGIIKTEEDLLLYIERLQVNISHFLAGQSIYMEKNIKCQNIIN